MVEGHESFIFNKAVGKAMKGEPFTIKLWPHNKDCMILTTSIVAIVWRIHVLFYHTTGRISNKLVCKTWFLLINL